MKRLLPIILAVLLALVAAGLVFAYTRGAEERVLEEQQPTSVLVSTAQIPQGIALGDAVAGGLAETTQVPSNLAPAGSLSAVTPDNASLVALSPVAPGQILLASNFGTELPPTTALPVPDGLLAMSLILGDPERVGSFLRPGSEVVVFSTYTSGEADPNADPEAAPTPVLTTRVLLDRALVLGVGDVTATQTATNPDGTPAAPAPSAFLTFAVDQDQAEKLIQSIRNGSQLYLGLLGNGTEIVKTGGATDGNLFE